MAIKNKFCVELTEKKAVTNFRSKKQFVLKFSVTEDSVEVDDLKYQTSVSVREDNVLMAFGQRRILREVSSDCWFRQRKPADQGPLLRITSNLKSFYSFSFRLINRI